MNEAPAEVLKEARQKILAMMDLGLSRDTLFNLVATSNPTTATDKPQNISQQQQQSQQSQQQQALSARPADGLIQDVKQEHQPTRPIDSGVSNGMSRLACGTGFLFYFYSISFYFIPVFMMFLLSAFGFSVKKHALCIHLLTLLIMNSASSFKRLLAQAGSLPPPTSHLRFIDELGIIGTC